jgi:hypothetical protein
MLTLSASRTSFCLDELGEDIDTLALWPLKGNDHPARTPPLSIAINHSCFRLAMHLVRRGAKVVFPRIEAEQPFYTTVSISDTKEALPLLRAMLERDKTVLDPDYYWGPAPTAEEVRVKVQNPLAAAAYKGKKAALELFLTTPGLEKVEEATTVAVTGDNKEGGFATGTPLAWAAHAKQWECCSLLLRHGKLKVLATGSDSDKVRSLPSAYSLIKKHCPDRRLVALVEAAAERERGAELLPASTSVAATPPAATASSNAFEDPSVKVLTEKEEKQKAKKRAAKKKAKAKKREKAREEAAGSATAGAGKEEPVSSDDDSSSGTDEEEAEMTEEERMLARAPTFDLEKEKAARKARAAAEAEEAAKKGKK